MFLIKNCNLLRKVDRQSFFFDYLKFDVFNVGPMIFRSLFIHEYFANQIQDDNLKTTSYCTGGRGGGGGRREGTAFLSIFSELPGFWYGLKFFSHLTLHDSNSQS